MNYQSVYDKLVHNAKSRNQTFEYSERHHIVPKSMGGSDDSDNLVVLSGREHFIAHKLLAKIHGGPMAFSFMMMCNTSVNEHGVTRYYVKSYDYELAKKLYALSRKGVPMTDEQKLKISLAQKERLKDPNERKKCSTRKGIPNSKEQRKMISDKMKGIPKKKTDPCPWCGMICNKATAVRWHYDNCKRKPT